MVNVECDRLVLDTARMIEGRTTGQILRALMERAGFSVREFAGAAGYAYGSGVQRYIANEYDDHLDVKVAHRLADALEGRGSPPIAKSEVLALTGLPAVSEAVPNTVLPPRYLDLPRDIPVYGTALGTFTENEAVEQTVVEMSDPIDYFVRPFGVAGRKGVYGLYVTGESQSPRFEPGEIVFADPARPPMIGDDVVVYLKKPDGDGEAISVVLIKKLVRRGHARIELRQLNPPAEFSVDVRKIAAIHRVLTNADLWGGYR